MVEEPIVRESEEQEELEPEEGTLEDLTEQPESEVVEGEDFSEFMAGEAGDMPTPTLETSPVVPLETPEDGNLEEIGSTVTSLAGGPGATEAPEEKVVVYNEPDYAAGYEADNEDSVLGNMRETGRMAQTAEQLRDLRPKVRMDKGDLWEMKQAQERQGGEIKDYITEVEAIDDKRKLPFQERKKYRPINRRKRAA